MIKKIYTHSKKRLFVPNQYFNIFCFDYLRQHLQKVLMMMISDNAVGKSRDLAKWKSKKSSEAESFKKLCEISSVLSL